MIGLLWLLLAPDTAFHWTLGSRVHALSAVCARPDTLGAGTGTCGTGGVVRATGDKGTIRGGPAGNSTKWGLSWYIHYDTGADGWSTQKYLALDTLFVPPPPPPPPPATLICGTDVPPRPGCGMRAPWWTVLLGSSATGNYGPWYVLDSLDRPVRVVRVTVKDTTP